MSNILAFDFGTKSIGVAVINSEAAAIVSAPQELIPLKAREGIPDWNVLETLLQEWNPDTVVVGLPINSDGSDMEITRRARKFGNRLKGRFGVPVEFIDETLSTKSAKHEARDRGHRGDYANAPVDSIAARLILESWLDQKNQPSNET